MDPFGSDYGRDKITSRLLDKCLKCFSENKITFCGFMEKHMGGASP